MIRKYTFGTPFDTGAAVVQLPAEAGTPDGFEVTCAGNSTVISRPLSPDAVIYGLGESVRGINKRGYRYVSFCTDIPGCTETTESLYSAHNFVIFCGGGGNVGRYDSVGLFIDCPSEVVFDLGFTDYNSAVITVSGGADVYVITGGGCSEICAQLRGLTGRSYIPPKWAFGYIQSRWGYRDADDVRAVVRKLREIDCPVDGVCLDLDYMDDYKDFTVSSERFGGFKGMKALSDELRAQGVRMVPIIDAGVKIEDGYDVYEEGRENGFFCKDENGEPFTVAVWPGRSVFPDVLLPDARRWFGMQYKRLTDAGIEGFWNDMNEPAIFYTPRGLSSAMQTAQSLSGTNVGINEYFKLLGAFNDLSRDRADLEAFYHETPQGRISHLPLHNLYGYNMARAAQEGFAQFAPDRRMLLFSRSSYIGMHRFAGLWTGDNCSWWAHLAANIKMMPSLSMCGFLYSGADIGGFGGDTSEDLLLRWLQFGIFTPLMRNHSAWDTREQEPYRFSLAPQMAATVRLRYRLIPYLYSEFLKCALGSAMLFRPLAFDYPQDAAARGAETQLMWGESVMLAPVCEQNAQGRYVYLPEDMLLVRFKGDEVTELAPMAQGHHYVDVPLDELVIFLRPGRLLPLGKSAMCVGQLDARELEVIGYADGAVSYELLDDDGFSLSRAGSEKRVISVRPDGGGWRTDDADAALRIVARSV